MSQTFAVCLKIVTKYKYRYFVEIVFDSLSNIWCPIVTDSKYKYCCKIVTDYRYNYILQKVIEYLSKYLRASPPRPPYKWISSKKTTLSKVLGLLEAFHYYLDQIFKVIFKYLLIRLTYSNVQNVI